MYNLIDETTVVEIVASTAITTTAPYVTSTAVDLVPYFDTPVVFFHTGGTQGTGGSIACRVQTSPPATKAASYEGSNTASVPLRNGAADNLTIGCKFTPSVACTAKNCYIQIQRAGAIAAEKYVKLEIQTDNAGVPSNTVIATATTLDPSTISTTYSWVNFDFTSLVDLTTAGTYHFVLSADYDASATVHLHVGVGTVASGGILSLYDASWAAVTTQKLNFKAYAYAWTDQTATTVEATHTLSSIGWNSAAGGQYMRAKADVLGGDETTTYQFAACMAAEKKVKP